MPWVQCRYRLPRILAVQRHSPGQAWIPIANLLSQPYGHTNLILVCVHPFTHAQEHYSYGLKCVKLEMCFRCNTTQRVRYDFLDTKCVDVCTIIHTIWSFGGLCSFSGVRLASWGWARREYECREYRKKLRLSNNSSIYSSSAKKFPGFMETKRATVSSWRHAKLS